MSNMMATTSAKEGIFRRIIKNPAFLIIGGAASIPILIIVLFYVYAWSSPNTVQVYQTPEKAVAGAKVGNRVILVYNALAAVKGTKTSLACQPAASGYECLWKAADGNSPASAIIRTSEKLENEAEGYFTMEVKVLDRQPNQLTTEFVRYVERPNVR